MDVQLQLLAGSATTNTSSIINAGCDKVYNNK